MDNLSPFLMTLSCIKLFAFVYLPKRSIFHVRGFKAIFTIFWFLTQIPFFKAIIQKNMNQLCGRSQSFKLLLEYLCSYYSKLDHFDIIVK